MALRRVGALAAAVAATVAAAAASNRVNEHGLLR